MQKTIGDVLNSNIHTYYTIAVNGMLRFITNGDIQQELDSSSVGFVRWLSWPIGTDTDIKFFFFKTNIYLLW